MKYYIIAGERSGDLHGSHLITSIKKLDAQAQIWAWGGDMMLIAGASIKKHYRELAIMGFWQVIMNLGKILENFKSAKKDLIKLKPDALILIDYPGFNLRMAKFAHEHNIPVFYYIAPKAWAWNKKRVYKIKKYVTQLFTIFPFESEFFSKFGIQVKYVGNPLIQYIDNYTFDHDWIAQMEKYPNRIALLPGSRKQEVKVAIKIFSKFIQSVDAHFIVSAVDNLPQNLYVSIREKNNVTLVYGKTYDILKASQAAFVTSGTATLETALIETPQAVCYKTGIVTYSLAKILLKIPYISLVNILANAPVVREMIQNEFSSDTMKEEWDKLQNSNYRMNMIKAYKHIKQEITKDDPNNAVASYIVHHMQQKLHESN